MAALNRTAWRTDQVYGRRYSGYTKSGYTGNHVKPTGYSTIQGFFPVLYLDGTDKTMSIVDVPNEHPSPRSKASFPKAVNQSWSKLMDKTRASPASLGVALAEGHEALGMITARATSVYRAFRELRKGRFRRMLSELSIGPKRKHRNKIRNSANEVSSLWLEYSFGWKPMTQDIYDACEVLQKPVPGGSFSGSGHQSYRYYNRTGSGAYVRITEWFGTAHVKQGADFYVTSPNLYLLQQLGVANPASIAWELVPFSFLADWAFDIGSFLGGFSDLLGLTVINPYCTFYLRAQGFVLVESGKYVQDGYIVRMVREGALSAPIPNFAFTANVGTSMTRAANAVSLLGQILTK